ncbi:MAG TPA: nucleoside-diphosphate sugar epimerase, partial [Xanthomonadaceae bacterium]|nr:nucleoside-diphosphate sugar epimerase [Xanthomonadaceae bacterium]
ALDLPGGERLEFGTVLARAVAAGAPGCRVLPLPWRAAALAGRIGIARGLAARLDADLCFDGAAAETLIGWSPRGFQPVAADFPP